MGNLASVSILDAWRALGGPEPRRGRAPAWWRNGDNPQAVSLSEQKQCWYDYVTHCSGGVLRLVETVLNCGRPEALKWLEGEGFIEPRTFTREQRRVYSNRRAAADTTARDIERWRSICAAELNARKVAAMEACDDSELRRAASLCNLLENGSPEDVVREFVLHHAVDLSDVARLIAEGGARQQKVRRITAELVLLLAGMAGGSRDVAA